MVTKLNNMKFINWLNSLDYHNIWLDWRSTFLGVIAGILVMLGEAIASPEGLSINGVIGGLMVAVAGGLSDLKDQDSKIIKQKNKKDEDES